MRRIVAVVAGLAVLAAGNWLIWQKERLLAGGRIVLLELAPVDPRSLMQGDYMALRFKVAGEAFGGERFRERPSDGHVVLSLDERGVGSFARMDEGRDLGENEVRMRYRVRGGQVKFATNAFFFQEGEGKRYSGARYGEFRVGDGGECILTGLRGEDLEPLGAPGK